MKRFSLFIIFMLAGFALLLANQVYSQSADSNKISYQISVEKLRSAATVDELIYDLPPGYKVLFYRISVSGKNIRYNENLNDTFYKAAEPGNKVHIEYIRVIKKGSNSRPVRLPPRELVVIE